MAAVTAYRSMDTAKYRQWIEIQSPASAIDENGDTVRTWVSVLSCWAKIISLTAREQIFADEPQGIVTHDVYCRWPWGLDIDPSMRVLLGTRVLQITSALNVDERNVELHMVCTEIKGAATNPPQFNRHVMSVNPVLTSGDFAWTFDGLVGQSSVGALCTGLEVHVVNGAWYQPDASTLFESNVIVASYVLPDAAVVDAWRIQSAPSGFDANTFVAWPASGDVVG